MNIDVRNKKVLVRVDFNVPLDKSYKITDDTRIVAAIPTIQYLLKNEAAVILTSHLGRPLQKLNPDGSINREKNTLRHTVQRLSELLGREVQFVNDCIGEEVQKAVAALKSGEVLLLENARFYPEEEKGEEHFARQLASLADVYINDAFGTAHRAHATTTIVANFFDKAHKSFGYLMEAELQNAKRVTENPEKPFTAIIGGAKVSDKILLLERLLDVCDYLLIGGGMAYTLLKAQGANIGKSLVEEDKLDLAKHLLAKAKAKGVHILLPEDSIIADAFDANANTQEVDSLNIPNEWMGLDIGTKARKKFAEIVSQSKTIFWNGPMGVFEMPAFAEGTLYIAQAVAQATEQGAYSLIGGGDSVSAINQAKLADKVSYVSTGGGAMLELLEGKMLPGVKAILA